MKLGPGDRGTILIIRYYLQTSEAARIAHPSRDPAAGPRSRLSEAREKKSGENLDRNLTLPVRGRGAAGDELRYKQVALRWNEAAFLPPVLNLVQIWIRPRHFQSHIQRPLIFSEECISWVT